jgi:glutamate-1-semialdehyde 2,1-aminomutase
VQVDGFYEKLSATTQTLMDGFKHAAHEHGIMFSAQSIGGMFGIYFSEQVPTSFEEVMATDKEAFSRFFHSMLDAGIYLGPSAFEAGFVSAAHGVDELERTIEAASQAFMALKK